MPPGAQAGPIEWPVPQRVAEGPLTTYAYTGDVVLPFTLEAGAGGLTMKAHAEWLTCRDVCVPEEASFELALPAGPPAPAPEAGLIDAALARIPQSNSFVTTLTPQGTLSVAGADLPTNTVSAEFFPTDAGAVDKTPTQQPVLVGDHLTLQIAPAGQGRNDTGRPGVLVLTTTTGVAHAYSVLPKSVDAPVVQSLGVLLLLAAFAGGLLLNLMPCVFPILAMKAMALARLSGPEARRVRAEAASYASGVVAAFVALGAALIALREAGVASGWGFQFQSSSFVIGVAWLLFAVGLNLSGVFEFGSSFVGRGDGLARRGGHLGSFLTGVLAVVVASPCTAPFMGTAIAGALALSNVAALSVFVALGLGLALPYTIIAMLPGVSRILPRPGAWMQTLQQLLAFPMYAAAAWLAWVVSQQTGATGVLTAGAGFVVVGFGAWSLGFAAHRSGFGRYLAQGSALTAVVVLVLLLATNGPGVAASEPTEPFTAARLEQLRTEGRPVFVNMTAAWCLSCLVNERVALSPRAVRDAFARSNVAYLKGDWTNQNSTVSTYLRQLGRDGVPLYVLYAPGRAPVVLPQLLTESTVLDELAKLKG